MDINIRLNGLTVGKRDEYEIHFRTVITVVSCTIVAGVKAGGRFLVSCEIVI